MISARRKTLAATLWLLLAFNEEQLFANGIAACEEEFRKAPHDYVRARCFYEAAVKENRWDQAAQNLQKLVAEFADSGAARLTLAHVQWALNDVAAEQSYRAAATLFSQQGRVLEEVLARANLRTYLFVDGRVGEAEQEVARIGVLVDASSDSEVIIRGVSAQARQLSETGKNFGQAYRLMRRAYESLHSGHDYWLRREVLLALGNSSLSLSKFEESVGYFRELLTAAEQADDRGGSTLAKFNIANALVEQHYEAAQGMALGEAQGLATEVLRGSSEGEPLLAVIAHRLLAELSMAKDPAVAKAHLAQCVDIAAASGNQELRNECIWLLSRANARVDASAADQLINQLLAELQTANASSMAHVFRHWMRVRALTQKPRDAMDSGMRALGAIEALRELQPLGDSRAATLAAWARDYVWLAGFALQAGAEEFAGDAFATMERLRARSLTELMSLERKIEPPTEYHTTLQEIVQLQRQLSQPGDTNAADIARLAQLEDREMELREVMFASQIPAVRPVTLPLAQANLAANEALLSYQFGNTRDLFGEFGGGSWLTLITRAQVRVYRLDDRNDLGPRLAVAAGLLRGGGELNGAMQAALSRALLGDAIEQLPPGVTRLVVIADDLLAKFPLAALLAKSDSMRAVGSVFEVDLIPSATWWVRQRPRAGAPIAQKENHDDKAAAPSPAWVFANPSTIPLWRGVASENTPIFDPLPGAEIEGRTIQKMLGEDTELFVGDFASEARLKGAAETASRWPRLLHFATHSVVDEVQAERSAVLLSPGNIQEDGLLQPREIAAFNLRETAVVLASCDSAGGVLVRGEGLMSLGRAFLLAGAPAVVGSIWPMRDDHSAAFFAAFYAQIKTGHGLGAAVSLARSHLRAQGYPAQAWAGWVLLGDGAFVPLPVSSTVFATPMQRCSLLSIFALIIAAMFGVAWLRRQRVTTERNT